MRLSGDVEYREWDFFDIERGHWCFVCRWHRPEDALAELVPSYFSQNPEEDERHFLRKKAWETYERHLAKVADR